MTKRIAVVGCGHWGRNFVRVVRECSGARLVAVVDENATAMDAVIDGRDGIRTWDVNTLMDRPNDIDAVVIATPASTHYELIRQAVDRGWDVLAEKPFTRSTGEAEALIELADGRGVIIMLGHTFLYNPAVRKMKALLDGGAVGQPYYLQATRTHLGLIRDDVNAVWDLAPHDIAIANYLLAASPVCVSAVGRAILRPDREDVAFITLTYPSGVVANLSVSWTDANKVRKVQVVGSRGRVVFDDLEPLERVKVYEKGIATNIAPNDFGEFQMSLRDGGIYSPKVSVEEPLKVELAHFLECITTRKRPISDARQGLEVVRVLSAIDQSMEHRGAPIAVASDVLVESR